MMTRMACLAGIAVAAWAQGAEPLPGIGLPAEGQVLRYRATWEHGYRINGEDEYPSRIEAQLAWRIKERTAEGVVLGLRIERFRVEKGQRGPGLQVSLDSEAPEGKEPSDWLKDEFEALVDPGGRVLRAPATGSERYQKVVELMVGEGWLHLGPAAAGAREVKAHLLHDMGHMHWRFKRAWLALVPVAIQEPSAPKDGRRRFLGAFKTQPGKGMGIGPKGNEMFLPDAEVAIHVEGGWSVKMGCWEDVQVITEVGASLEGGGADQGETWKVQIHSKLTLARMP